MVFGQTSATAEFFSVFVPAVLAVAVGLPAAIAVAWWRSQKKRSYEHLDALFAKYLARGQSCGLFGLRLEFGDRRFAIRQLDRRAYAFLKAVVERRLDASDPDIAGGRLVDYRHDLRSIIALKPIAGLVACLRSDDRELRMLGIWLLGRCESHSVVGVVSQFSRDPNPAIRWRVAQALGRLRGLVELQSMAHEDADPRIRRLAQRLSVSIDQTYSTRLRRFVEHGGTEQLRLARRESHMPVFFLRPVEARSLPKTRELIRRILQHIRQLVRGSLRNGPNGAKRTA